MRIAVASGKGGTGKTLLATHLADTLSRRAPGQVVLGDADVEAPNSHLFLHPKLLAHDATRWVPELVGPCDDCGECERVCAFNAIVPIGKDVAVFADLCHACGACLTACPLSSLGRKTYVMGHIRTGDVGDLAFIDGILNVGEARATPLVEQVINALDDLASTRPIQIVDCPPGTSCAAMAAIHTADHVLLVTEPTPFGLHDLELAAEMVAELGVPASIILNRSDLGDPATFYAWAKARDLPVLAEIPFDQDIARAGAHGTLAQAPLKPALDAIITAMFGAHQP